MIRDRMLIDGEPADAASGETFSVLNPSTEQPMGEVPRAGAADVELAVSAARNGYQSWSSLAPREREACLLRAADLVEREGKARFLDLLIDESGSTINKAGFEIAYTVDLLRTAAGESRRLYGDTFPNDASHRLSMVFREPVGVVAVISPYNAPLALLTKMAAFPLAAGNSVVVKPSEETPLVALAFARLLLESGLPEDAVNVVTGFGAECGGPLVNHPGVDAIALTGSTGTGRIIGAAAMQRMCRAQLELGGKSAILVLEDADPEEAAKIAVAGMFNHAGQICMANSRMIVAKPLFEAFCSAAKAACEAMPLGDLRDTSTAYGPLINRAALEKVQAHQAQALEKGASLLTGGAVHQGLVYQPTLLLDTPRDSGAWCDESFGPLASVVAAKDFDNAIGKANDSAYGLSAAVLTHDVKKAFRAARALRSGAVHIGMHAFQSNALAPVGGVGLSGLGRSGGRYSVEEFTELKWVSVELGD
jgi:aldehyde dehydrogenase (NAD+)